MKFITGVLMMLAGIALGLYVGGWICFVGGIVDIIEQFKAESIAALSVAVGCLKIVCASGIGTGCALLLFIPGMAILSD